MGTNLLSARDIKQKQLTLSQPMREQLARPRPTICRTSAIQCAFYSIATINIQKEIHTIQN